MPKKKQINIAFPLAGLNRKSAYRQQPPYTSTDLLNVRAVTGLDGRERGGSRPGLIQSHYDIIGDGEPVRMLTTMTIAMGDGFTAWSDTFSGSSMAEAWTQAAWATAMPSILQSSLAGITYAISEGEAVADQLDIDTTKAYTVEAILTPWAGAWHGTYRLYLRLDNENPDIRVDGVMVELTQTGTTGAYTGKLRSVSSGVATDYTFTAGSIGSVNPGWLSASISGDTVTVYWNNTTILTQAVDAHSGSRFGFGLKCTVDGGLALANVFRVQYYDTNPVSNLRSLSIASSFSGLYYESSYGRWTELDTDVCVRDDVLITAAQSGQKLYIADFGEVTANGTDGAVSGTALTATSITDWRFLGIDPSDYVVVTSNSTGTAVDGTYGISAVNDSSLTLSSSAGTGNCAYRIERAPKIYDPIAQTLTIWSATAGKGQIPTGCPIVWRYLDRLYLAGAENAPHVWSAMRQGDPLDADFSQTDSQRAIFGPASEAGVPGDPITAGLAHSDDYSIIACRDSLWRLAGDPAAGGSLDNLSHAIGIIGRKAWCFTPTGELVFLSMDGLYVLPPGGNTYPVAISRELLPREFMNINPDMVTASLEYDVQNQGVHIYLTSEVSNDRLHWWMDWNRKTFWPVSLDSDYEPTATCTVQATAIEDSGVLLGGRDGVVRRFSDYAENDCGSAFTSYAVIGPVPLAKDAMCGQLESMDADIAENSGDVTWSIQPGLTFESAISATSTDTGTFVDGINSTVYPACRGQACVIKLTGQANRRWALEQITGVVKESGVRRIP